MILKFNYYRCVRRMLNLKEILSEISVYKNIQSKTKQKTRKNLSKVIPTVNLMQGIYTTHIG